jgi:putative membrane protein insertion efficiency factor
MSKKRYITLKKAATFPFLVLIYIYKYLISPLMPGGCRHYPTCSVYALDALKMHGPAKGTLMASNRILRCHPWGTHGLDPVPILLFKKIKLKKYGIRSKKQHPSCDRLKQ